MVSTSMHAILLVVLAATATVMVDAQLPPAPPQQQGPIPWAVRAGGIADEAIYGAVSDASGNAWVTGFFTAPNMTIGTFFLQSAGQTDAFLAKLDQQGRVLFATGLGGTGSDYAFGITLDASSNIIVVGVFDSPTLQIGTTTLTNRGLTDGFVGKWAPTGQLLWAQSFGGAGDDSCSSVAVDTQGNVAIGGAFSSATIPLGTSSVSNFDASGNSFDLFVAKLTAAQGFPIWVKTAGREGHEGVNGVACDSHDNVVAVGTFNSRNITIVNLINNKNSQGASDDTLVIMISAAGDYQWALSGGGVADDQLYGVSIDQATNSIYCGGAFGSTTAAFGNVILTNAGAFDALTMKLSSTGSVLWAVRGGGSGYDYVFALSSAAVPDGGPYVVGAFSSPTATFDNLQMSNVGQIDAFLVKYDKDGHVTFGGSGGGGGSDIGYAVAVDPTGNAYMAGGYSSPLVAFGLGSIENVAGNAGTADGFVVRVLGAPTSTASSSTGSAGGSGATGQQQSTGGGSTGSNVPIFSASSSSADASNVPATSSSAMNNPKSSTGGSIVPNPQMLSGSATNTFSLMITAGLGLIVSVALKKILRG